MRLHTSLNNLESAVQAKLKGHAHADNHTPTFTLGKDDGNLTAFAAGGYIGTDQERWDFWSRYMQPLISTRPHQSLAGNHEEETVRSGALQRCRPSTAQFFATRLQAANVRKIGLDLCPGPISSAFAEDMMLIRATACPKSDTRLGSYELIDNAAKAEAVRQGELVFRQTFTRHWDCSD